jgi:hypothetical protein
MYNNCSAISEEIMGAASNDEILEKKRKKLEVKYMQCLKEFYVKNDLMNNNCDVYVKEYENMNKKQK